MTIRKYKKKVKKILKNNVKFKKSGRKLHMLTRINSNFEFDTWELNFGRAK